VVTDVSTGSAPGRKASRIGGRPATIASLATYVPPRLLTNADLEKMVDTTDDWILQRTGIRERHIVDPGVATSDLGKQAAIQAIANAGLTPADIGMVICGTVTPDMMFPSTACLIQHKIGAHHAWGFDLSAACSAFTYSLTTACQFVASGAHEHVLVVGADVMSSIIDYKDRATCVIFGDGAGAVVLRAGEPYELGAIGPFDLGSDGEGADLIKVPDRHSFFVMDGQKVFLRAITHMAKSAEAVLDKASMRLQDIDKFVYHQANARILYGVADQLGQPRGKFVRNIDLVGNTAASPCTNACRLPIDPMNASGNQLPLTVFSLHSVSPCRMCSKVSGFPLG